MAVEVAAPGAPDGVLAAITEARPYADRTYVDWLDEAAGLIGDGVYVVPHYGYYGPEWGEVAGVLSETQPEAPRGLLQRLRDFLGGIPVFWRLDNRAIVGGSFTVGYKWRAVRLVWNPRRWVFRTEMGGLPSSYGYLSFVYFGPIQTWWIDSRIRRPERAK